MSISLLFFMLSGAGIILFVTLKMIQIKTGLLFFWPDTRNKIETVFKRQFAVSKDFLRTFNTRTVYLVIHYALVKIRKLFAYLQQKIDNRLIHLVNLIKGKRLVETKGKTSRFLHDINKFKDKFKRQ